jgi:hypothetical protein
MEKPTMTTVLGTVGHEQFTVVRRLNPYAGNVGGHNGQNEPLFFYSWGFDSVANVHEWNRDAQVRAVRLLRLRGGMA